MSENERREQAFLAVLRYAEGGGRERADAYTVRNGGGHFSNMSQHPGKSRDPKHTSASGAYQIMFGTYNDMVKRGAPRDFSPHSQDQMALQILRDKGVLHYIWDGNIDAAMSLLTRTWSSLPGGTESHITTQQAEAYFRLKLDEMSK